MIKNQLEFHTHTTYSLLMTIFFLLYQESSQAYNCQSCEIDLKLGQFSIRTLQLPVLFFTTLFSIFFYPLFLLHLLSLPSTVCENVFFFRFLNTAISSHLTFRMNDSFQCFSKEFFYIKTLPGLQLSLPHLSFLFFDFFLPYFFKLRLICYTSLLFHCFLSRNKKLLKGKKNNFS